MRATLQPALFIDRDGVINYDHGYTHKADQFQLLPGVTRLLRRFSDAGYALVVVTNQAGIARGFYTEAQFMALTKHMGDLLAASGIELTGVYYCPHHPDGVVSAIAVACDCRKPAPGMLLRAAREHGLDLARSWMIGDKPSDVEAGRRAGLAPERCLLVIPNAGLEEHATMLSLDPIRHIWKSEDNER